MANNDIALIGLIGLGIAAVAVVLGHNGTGSGANARSTPSIIAMPYPGSDRGAASPTAGVDQDPQVSGSTEAGFARQVVERTGYLPSGFDAAGRVSQITRGNVVGL